MWPLPSPASPSASALFSLPLSFPWHQKLMPGGWMSAAVSQQPACPLHLQHLPGWDQTLVQIYHLPPKLRSYHLLCPPSQLAQVSQSPFSTSQPSLPPSLLPLSTPQQTIGLNPLQPSRISKTYSAMTITAWLIGRTVPETSNHSRRVLLEVQFFVESL